MGNRIEPASSGRSKCMVCNLAIAKGEARLAEEYSDVGIPKLIMRFYHLKCAAAAQPELLHHALQNDVRMGATFDREELEQRLAPAIEHAKQQRIANYQAKQAAIVKPAVATDATTLAVLQQLEADPEDADTLAIVADQLTLRGDPRGELITVQLSLAKIDRRPKLRPTPADDDDDEDADAEAEENEATAKALARRYEELMMQLALPTLGKNDRAIWGTGFVRRLELVGKSATRLTELESLWSHPTLHVLAELKLDLQSATDASAMAALARVVRPSIRRLELGEHSDWALEGVSELLAALPQLRSLVLGGRLRTPIGHATLESLKLLKAMRVGDLPAALQHVTAAALPGLRELVLEGFDETNRYFDWTGNQISAPRVLRVERIADELDPIVAMLASNGLLAQLTQLTISGGVLTDAGIEELRKALNGRRLARLDVTATPLPASVRAQLEKLSDVVVGFTDATPRSDGELWVEHANQPGWGRGKILRRFEGKLEVQFPKPVGKKVFKADAAFLRFG